MQSGLVRRAQRGDAEAFAALVPAAVGRLVAVAFRILRDPGLAEDATQRALVIAWRRLPTLRDRERFDAWTYRLVVNACYAESGHRRSNITPLRRLTDDAAVVDSSGQTLDRDRLERGFKRLSLAHRTVVGNWDKYRSPPRTAPIWRQQTVHLFDIIAVDSTPPCRGQPAPPSWTSRSPPWKSTTGRWIGDGTPWNAQTTTSSGLQH